MTGSHAIISLLLFVPAVMFLGKFVLRRAGRTVVKNYPMVVMPPPYPAALPYPPPVYPPAAAYPPPPFPTAAPYPMYPTYPAPAPFPVAPEFIAPPIPQQPLNEDQQFDAIVRDFYSR